MTSAHSDAQATASGDRYQALLAVSEAIVSHRDLSALLHELAGRLRQVVRLQPALVLGGLRSLGYGNPIVSEAVLTTAIPTMPIVIMWAVQYRVAEAEAASAVFLSMIGSLITLGAFIDLTS